MAEGHNAVAFSFSVSPEGVNVNFNHELWRAVWASGVRSWRKRIGMMKVSDNPQARLLLCVLFFQSNDFLDFNFL